MDDRLLIFLLIISPLWIYAVARLFAKGAMRSVLEELISALNKLAKKEE